MVTRKIHQTWKTRDLTPYNPLWARSWKDKHPGWEYHFYTDLDNSRLIRSSYPEFSKIYERLDRGVVKSDVVRCLYLHKFGGIYADMDFLCLKPFDRLVDIEEDIVIGYHARQQPYPNAWMYSKPGVAFWLQMVEDALQAFQNGERHVESICGPTRLEKALESYTPAVRILPPEILYSFPWGDTRKDSLMVKVGWDNPDAISRVFPNAYAVTSWSHCW